MRQPGDVDAAAGNREGRQQRAERPPQIGVDRRAGGLGEGEPAADVGIDHPVRADDAEDLPEQDLGTNAVIGVKERPRERRVGEDRQSRRRRHHPHRTPAAQVSW